MYNQRIRELLGLKEALPVAGDKLVCLRNDRVKGLINGGLWRVEALGGMRKDFVRMTVRADDDVGRAQAKVAVLKQFFEGAEADLPYPVRRESDEFDYGYALDRPQVAGLAVGPRHAVRRKPRLPRASRALALHRPHARGAPAYYRALSLIWRAQHARMHGEGQNRHRDDDDRQGPERVRDRIGPARPTPQRRKRRGPCPANVAEARWR